jgi:hypothetical protein
VSPRVRLLVLRVSGTLLVFLGVLHLAVTPLVAQLVLLGAVPDAVDWLTPPMLLNHLVVGILLLPLGALTLYAARDASSGAGWALTVTRIIAVAIAPLPPTLFVVMGTRYFAAVPFLTAAVVVCVTSVSLLVAAFSSAQQALPSMPQAR